MRSLEDHIYFYHNTSPLFYHTYAQYFQLNNREKKIIFRNLLEGSCVNNLMRKKILNTLQKGYDCIE